MQEITKDMLIADAIQKPNVNPKLLSALSRYQGDSSALINMILRGEEQKVTEYLIKHPKILKATAYRDIKTLKDAFKEVSPIKEPIKLYRKDNYEFLSNQIVNSGKYNGQPVGEVMRKMETTGVVDVEEVKRILCETQQSQKTFLSTSLTLRGANNAGRSTRPIQWNIITQGEVKGLFAGSHSFEEMEFLLKQGAILKPTNVRFIDNKWQIDAILKY